MSTTIRSILCTDRGWYWDPEEGSCIKFNSDGTGELECFVEYSTFIGAEFEWKTDDALDTMVDVPRGSKSGASQLIRELRVEIALSHRRSTTFRSGPLATAKINEDRLTDQAFRPKTYHVRLERGIFGTPSQNGEDKEIRASTQAFALRLVCDPSPYPPRQEWKGPQGGPESLKFWEWKEFVSRDFEVETSNGARCAVI